MDRIMELREKIIAWMEKNVGPEAAQKFSNWATDERWTEVMAVGREHALKFKEYAKDHEVKSRDDVYAYLRATYGDDVADHFKKIMEDGSFKEMAKKFAEKYGNAAANG